MPKERYYTKNSFQEGSCIILQDDEFHHLAHVMRQREGEMVELIDGRGALATARIGSLTRNSASLAVIRVSTNPPPAISLILVQALSPSNRLEDVLEKGTELGTDAFWMFGADKSKKTVLSASQHRRFEKILLSATKQSGRLYLPKLCVFSSLSSLFFDIPASAPLLFGDTDPTTPHLLKIRTEDLFTQPTTSLFFCTGPESGWSSQELRLLSEYGARAVSLGSHTLRMETAATTAAAFLNFLIGNQLKIFYPE